MDNNYNGDNKGWFGLLMAALSWLATCFSFAIEHYQYITVPLSVVASIYAIKYYRTATKAINKKNNGIN